MVFPAIIFFINPLTAAMISESYETHGVKGLKFLHINFGEKIFVRYKDITK